MAEHAPPIPLDDYEYPVVLGQSMFGASDDQQDQGDVYASFGYEFQPASVDKGTPGLVSVDGSGSVQVLMASSMGGVSFKGKLVEHKETDCLLLFDGSGFRLEHCPFSCLQLRHVRAPAPRSRLQIQPEVISGTHVDSKSGSKEIYSPAALATTSSLEIGEKRVGRPRRKQNKRLRSTPEGLATATSTAKRRGRPIGSVKAAMKTQHVEVKTHIKTKGNK